MLNIHVYLKLCGRLVYLVLEKEFENFCLPNKVEVDPSVMEQSVLVYKNVKHSYTYTETGKQTDRRTKD